MPYFDQPFFWRFDRTNEVHSFRTENVPLLVLRSVPRSVEISAVWETFGQFGEVKNVQCRDNLDGTNRTVWVEFQNGKLAREVAAFIEADERQSGCDIALTTVSDEKETSLGRVELDLELRVLYLETKVAQAKFAAPVPF